MRLAVLAAVGAIAVAACGGGNGEVKVNASASSSSEDDKNNATFSASGQADPNASGTAKTGTDAPEPASSSAPAPAPAAPSTCPLVCMVAQKGRAAQADEQRLAGELSGVLGALRLCGNGQNSLTMRFDSGATLTGFGVDAERGNEGACVDAIRQQRPAVTYQGPATLRCAERCGGQTTTTTRRRRGR